MTRQSATVIATYSRRMTLRLEDGEEVQARIKGKKLKPVCGDRVTADAISGEQDWLITGIETRRNELTRPDSRGHVEVLAANLDALVVVAAVSPLPDWFIVDRYLCAAELMGIESILVFNKVDLLAGHDIQIDELQEYREFGLTTLECSADSGVGLQQLQQQLADRCAIVVGQSGVGKSSLINEMADAPNQRTADISTKTGEGRHTTVNSVMITLRAGGVVIDSPGVRDYAPALTSQSEVARGFREIAEAAQICRFANCRHLREPGCAVKAAVDQDAISFRRYESYKRLVNLTAKLSEGRY